MSRVLQNYCTECEWSASSADYTVHERTQLAINHAVSEDHDIDCVLESDGSSDDGTPWIVRDSR